ncbi:MAG: hypothetical protein ACTSRP_01465 [Candidatus Helarchaeota archaeon]
MKTIFFLFTEKISLERLGWIINCLNNEDIQDSSQYKYIFYVSGDALYSLQDKRYFEFWVKILNSENIKIVIDSWELSLLGINIQEMKTKFELKLDLTGVSDPLLFWKKLIEDIRIERFDNIFGFLEMRGPYLSRTSVHCLRSLKAAAKHRLKPELYCYLDGIHLGHNCQKPSEFENIGEGLLEVQNLAKKMD